MYTYPILGTVSVEKHAKPDVTIQVSDADFIKLLKGTLNNQAAFMQGKIKVKGNMSKALLFTPDIIPADVKAKL